MATRRIFLQTMLAAGLTTTVPSILESTAAMPYTPRFNTRAHRWLAIEAGYNKEQAEKATKRLDEILTEGAKHLKVGQKSSSQVRADLETISRLLSVYPYENQFLLSEALMNGKLDCDTRSTVYLAFSDIFSLGLQMVLAPKHTFVRYDPRFTHRAPQAKQDTFNWETCTLTGPNRSAIGAYKTDQEYMDSHSLSVTDVKNGLYLKSLDRKETDAVAHAIVGARFFKDRNWSQAVKEFSVSRQGSGKLVFAHCYEGLANFMLRRNKDAASAFERYTGLVDDFMGNYCLAVSLYHTGDYGRSGNALAKAALHQRNHDTYYLEGLLEMRKGNSISAEISFRLSLQYRRDFDKAKEGLVEVLIKLDKPKEALPFAKDLVKNAGNPYRYMLLSRTYEGLGQKRKALDMMRKASNTFPAIR